MHYTKHLCYLLVAAFICACKPDTTNTIDLSGQWLFKMDTLDVGVTEKWYLQDFNDSIMLPGSMAENGKGFNVTFSTKWTGGIKNPEWYKHPNYAPYTDSANVKYPYWLQPVKKYTGAAWYNKTVYIPEQWSGAPVFINLEHPHWQSSVWVNGVLVGSENSLGTPHVYNISNAVKKGENRISICIDNRSDKVDVGENSHSISDHTQSNWNGIVGDISLSTKSKIYTEQIAIYPDITSKSIAIKAEVVNATPKTKNTNITVYAQLKNKAVSTVKKTFDFEVQPGKNTISTQYNLGEDALLWDEFNPNVYQLIFEVNSKEGTDKTIENFGLRNMAVNGSRFFINNKPIFLRGTLECAIFPKTGYPPTDSAYWEKIYSTVKAYGLNHIRFHSWCPPSVAFDVADQMGVYLQVECSSWANQSTQLGSGLPIDDYIWAESKRIVRAYGNHPSFIMMAYGNEPGGPKFREYLTAFLDYWKQEDPRRLYTGGAGWPVIAANEYHNIPQPRIQQWGEGLNSIINAEPPKTNYDWHDKLPQDGKPVISHEIGQWCAYPNFKEISKYTGVLKAKNFELFQESLEAHHIGQLADSLLLASGKLQVLCYKADIEAALRTPEFAGFQLLDLHDFPGQGTALVGVLDAFWDEKGYVTAEEYSQFCNTTVPLARLDKRIFTEGETMTAKIEIAHFGAEPIANVIPSWKITSNHNIIAEGTLNQCDINIGNAITLGSVTHQFKTENTPRKLTLSVSVNQYTNTWDVWVYPKNNTVENSVVKIIERLDNATMAYIKNGGRALLSLGKGKVTPEMGGEVGVGFSSIFWNTAWTNQQKPHTLGILCNPKHPALKQFPTEYHSNWQWWDAMSHCDAIRIDALSQNLKPIVRIIDDWVTNRNLAMIFEAKLGKGSIMVSGVDLINNMEQRPEARQLKQSLLNYMESPEFRPTEELGEGQLQSILK
ncbi:MAG: sugar-binding domain-containing protein [Flavobacteriaceae bacterium]